MKTEFVESVSCENTGGGCYVDFVTLKDGRVLGINEEYVVLYDSMDDVWEGEHKERPAMKIPPKKLMSDEQMANLATEAADVAIAHIQAKIGQTDGGFAGDFFSNDEQWNTLTTVLFDYLNAELKSGLLNKP
jgi:hypothetical protein